MYLHGVYRFLLSWQWLIITLVGLVLIPVMIELGFWQLHRHEHKVAQNERITAAVEAPPVPAEELTSPGHTVPTPEVWRRVTGTGRFDAAHEVVVRRRTNDDGSIGFHVLTPLVLRDGKVLLVNRGWIPANGAQTEFPKIPAPPTGEVTVTGRLKADETSAASGIKNLRDLPPRQIMLIDSAEESARLHRQVLGGYIEQIDPKPSGHTPQLLAEPDHSGIGPHMAYAVQWWMFSAAVPLGWWILVRRERRDREAAAREAEQAEAAEPEPAGV
nr:SURF1 family protein [Streptomyces sp. SID8380]